MSESASETINLSHDITVNGKTIPAGRHSVPKEQAADLMRMDKEYSDHLKQRHIRHDYQRSAGTLAVGSGAE